VLGNYLAKQFRMPDHGWKIGICLFSLFASIVILAMGPKFKLGVDLKGGVILIYEVDQSKKADPGQPLTNEAMDKLLAAVAKRVNPGGQKEVTIRKYGAEQIEIIIPDVDEAEVARIEKVISTTGNLEFRILANNRNDKDLIERAMADPSKMQILDSDNKWVAQWIPIRKGEEHSFANYGEIATRKRKVAGNEITEILVVKDFYDVTGGYLTRADVGADRKGQPCVNFTFNPEGGQRFGGLTGDHLPDKGLTEFTYKLGIILDGELYSAPSIQSTITDRGEITGSFTPQEVQDLVNVLNAGSLPAALMKDPITKLFSGATLGADTIEKSRNAMIISSILVPLFMLWYYRFCGIVAVVALVLNMLMLIAIMVTIKATFTLTGFAGLALTVGMAVDNNVLIYERLREELDRGATLRMAIRNAFHRASATVIDCNLTHLIAATVMYAVGSDQLRGFAVPLWLGTAISIFTAVFVSHVIFEVADKRQWITQLTMKRLIGHTNIDFMGAFRYCLTASVLVTVISLAVAFHRGQSLFDIDFTGGTSVQALFAEPQDTGKVRKLLSDKLSDLAVSDVQIAGEEKGLRFNINTSERNLQAVKDELSTVFGKELTRNAVTIVGEPKLIEGPAKGVPAVEDKAKQAKPADVPPPKQSRNDLPNNSMLAFAGDDAMALALADEPAKPAADKPAADKPAAAAKPAEKTPPAAAPAAKAGPHKASPIAEAKPQDAKAEKPAVVAPDPFVGGTAVQLKFKEKIHYRALDQLLKTAMEGLKIVPETVMFQVSNAQFVEGDMTTYDEWNVKILLPPDKTKALLSKLEEQVAASPLFPASSNIGAAVAGNTKKVAILAIIASWVGIIVYLWIRFQGAAFGLAAVIALIHDVLVMLGGIAVSYYIAPYCGFLLIEPFKINLPIVAAFLTIIGYSVNDTIVVFDRIREVRGKNPDLTRQMVNDSTNQTLSRTVLTSVTVAIVVAVLYFFGGDAIHGMAFALVVGVITGTYSSIYVAAPILLWLVGKHKQIVG
jgi:SecD/SecF fusion protein